MGFWEKVREIFWKKEGKLIEKDAETDTLIYTGDEPDCWACQMPIHITHKTRKLNGNKMHRTCFKKLKRIALNGDSLDTF